MCVLTAPAVFDQDPDDGRVLPARPPAAADEPAAREAALLCPSGAITIRDQT